MPTTISTAKVTPAKRYRALQFYHEKRDTPVVYSEYFGIAERGSGSYDGYEYLSLEAKEYYIAVRN